MGTLHLSGDPPPKPGRKSPSDEVSAATRKMRLLRSLACGNKFEKLARAQGATLIAGVDEVGRGSLFGPVVAAAVILPADTRIRGLRDSKQLLEEDRVRLDAVVRSRAIAIAIEEVDAETIDRVNIYQASRMAMTAAVLRLLPQPDHLLIDALRLDLPHGQTSIIYGDSLSISIAAASVVAKVWRDARMRELDVQYPGYGLASHKGYATPEHREALRKLGPCLLHRKSFAPVAQTELPWDDAELIPGEEDLICPSDSSA
ncbi:MAG TPA: ribonuclease HII [Acidobacteriaceae bacterium]|nr:ribonuclease HII [Acidobacteriaceae bacterium]